MVSSKIISFYSFKGGTGRSTTLANVAHALAEEGATVGCMDLDLAAPGLHMIFDVGIPHAHAATIHDHLQGYESDIDDYILDVGETMDPSPKGDLFLIAGKVETPGDDNPYQMMQDALELRQAFRDSKNLDYLLLDSRSGLSNHMFPVFDKADYFLTFHKWTHQHKLGTDKLADWVHERTSLNDVMSVASNVPEDVPEEEIETWVRNELFGFDDYHIINSSDILKRGEEVVTLTNPETKIAEQYRSLARRLMDL